MSINEQSASPNRARIVMEIAMRTRFKERQTKEIRTRPTIDELEKLLNEPEPPSIDILPDGNVAVTEDHPVFISDLVDAGIAALYADGFKIVRQDDAKEPQ